MAYVIASWLACCAALAAATSTPVSVQAFSQLLRNSGALLKGAYAHAWNYEETLAQCRKLHGSRCCADSGCWELAGQGCHARRGTTTCVGSSSVPMKRGVCACRYGACDRQGTCSQDPKTWHMLESAFSANVSSAAIARPAARPSGWAWSIAASSLAMLAGAGLAAASRAAVRRRWASGVPGADEGPAAGGLLE
mmetsp:Transcript_46747/g.144766  ORF Transcript_46747/g.144766 Transcript_46747/m.144766 type:complete len:194 (+) Transcript_46747:53-634(+)